MEWQVVVALIIAVPVILFPVAFVWYINIGGLYSAIKERRAARSRAREIPTDEGQHVTVGVNEQPHK
jgi:hypothetical protein